MRSNLIRYLSKLNPRLNCQEPKLARSYELARIKPSRLRRGSTGFSASSLLTEKRRLPVAAGAARPAVGSVRGLIQDVVDPHLASGGRPRRCRSSSRQIGVRRSHTLRRGRRVRARSDSPGRPCESQAPGPCWPSRASSIISAGSPRPCRGRCSEHCAWTCHVSLFSGPRARSHLQTRKRWKGGQVALVTADLVADIRL